MRYPVVTHKDPQSDYGITVPDLPGCFSAGATMDEALQEAVEAIECHLEGMLIDVQLTIRVDRDVSTWFKARGAWLPDAYECFVTCLYGGIYSAEAVVLQAGWLTSKRMASRFLSRSPQKNTAVSSWCAFRRNYTDAWRSKRQKTESA